MSWSSTFSHEVVFFTNLTQRWHVFLQLKRFSAKSGLSLHKPCISYFQQSGSRSVQPPYEKPGPRNFEKILKKHVQLFPRTANSPRQLVRKTQGNDMKISDINSPTSFGFIKFIFWQCILQQNIEFFQ